MLCSELQDIWEFKMKSTPPNRAVGPPNESFISLQQSSHAGGKKIPLWVDILLFFIALYPIIIEWLHLER